MVIMFIILGVLIVGFSWAMSVLRIKLDLVCVVIMDSLIWLLMLLLSLKIMKYRSSSIMSI